MVGRNGSPLSQISYSVGSSLVTDFSRSSKNNPRVCKVQGVFLEGGAAGGQDTTGDIPMKDRQTPKHYI